MKRFFVGLIALITAPIWLIGGSVGYLIYLLGDRLIREYILWKEKNATL